MAKVIADQKEHKEPAQFCHKNISIVPKTAGKIFYKKGQKRNCLEKKGVFISFFPNSA